MDFGIFSTSSLPALVYTVPIVGTVDFTPYVFSVALFFGIIIAVKIIQVIVIARLRRLSRKTSTNIDDAIVNTIESIRFWVVMLVALYVALIPVALPHSADVVIRAVILFAVVWQGIEIVVRFIDYLATRFLEKDEDGDGVIDPNSATASDMILLMARIILWSLGILFVLSNLGIEITSLIAGLGIGGIAVAFALQGILSDLFSSFSIYFDKPFRIGDFIVIGDNSGTVERIGIKTTRIRTLQGEELVVSNAELTTVRVQNFKRMKERRIVYSFGVTYETPEAKVAKIPEMVEKILKETEDARLDRVHFTTLGDSALIFEMVYYVDSAVYAKYLDVQQAINLSIMAAFQKEKIEFAYPTQTLYVKK
ncbi:mechanosensitive ion channel family protein [Candidatus Parcubacteria bacterium]|uniref:Mechanosensitive ion channel protein MscS n=1 Tax=Candidatus Kaiserbacteria bacterium CG10_big_fil_rev_8_21_14_0_10_47_16 TaxID=1974608 RepID=A0A2H0UDW8_9BACT|nr:mechanosensitive ion channel family protein [Candidatus Parcubacteria bacterium]PIR84577.1 MAG: mechanosensitive ion channel protein MscS [Candidatus Kaiserbacteria bacterium CG10_big_fil_rev_8_21_14_0_10_47_16]